MSNKWWSSITRWNHLFLYKYMKWKFSCKCYISDYQFKVWKNKYDKKDPKNHHFEWLFSKHNCQCEKICHRKKNSASSRRLWRKAKSSPSVPWKKPECERVFILAPSITPCCESLKLTYSGIWFALSQPKVVDTQVISCQDLCVCILMSAIFFILVVCNFELQWGVTLMFC